MKTKIWQLPALLLLLGLTACSQQSTSQKSQISEQPSMTNYLPKPYVEIEHPAWVKNATIYEVNVRQYTPQGTFNAFAEHLPRLKALGVDILWLMPIHPIGEKNRKGEKGSY